MTSAIQSVLLPKSNYTEKKAGKWITDRGFSIKGKRIKNYKTTNFYRFRQRPPSHFEPGSIYTIVKKDIHFIIGNLKIKHV